MKQLMILVLAVCGMQPALYAQLQVQLKDNEPGYHPRNFHIVKVVDGRGTGGSIGKVKEGEILLPGSPEQELMRYLGKIPATAGTVPVIMRINKMEVSEKTAGSKRQFELQVGIAYYNNNKKLIEYSGRAYNQSHSDAAPYIERLLRENINSNLKTFDEWMAKNKNVINATPTVTVRTTFSSLTDKKNLIPYDKRRKLYITDFRGMPDEASPGAAATYSGIGMNYTSRTQHNKTNVDVTISVYFDNTKSWMKDNGKNATILQHEQGHFDITAAIGCRLLEQIKNTDFTPANYQQQLKELLTNADKTAAALQNEYDKETEHGTITDAQEKWNRKIEQMIFDTTCY